MSQPTSEPATAAPTLAAALAAVRGYGLRLSAARRVVLAALYAADGPLSAEQIAAGVGGRVPTSDVASVYRNLETLERLGIVRHTCIWVTVRRCTRSPSTATGSTWRATAAEIS